MISGHEAVPHRVVPQGPQLITAPELLSYAMDPHYPCHNKVVARRRCAARVKCALPLPSWLSNSDGNGIQVCASVHGEAQLIGR